MLNTDVQLGRIFTLKRSHVHKNRLESERRDLKGELNYYYVCDQIAIEIECCFSCLACYNEKSKYRTSVKKKMVAW